MPRLGRCKRHLLFNRSHLPIVGAPHLFPPSAPPAQALMRAQLERIKRTEGLSDNVFEIVSKTLKD